MWSVNWSSLVYSSRLLLLLSILGTALYVGLMLGLDAVGQRSTPFAFKSWVGTWLSLRSCKARRIVSRWAPRVGMLAVGYILGSAAIFSPVREFHNVEVLRKDADRVYTMKFEGQQKPITVKLCTDGDDLPLKAGMVIDPFQFIQRSDCSLINRDTFVDYWRVGKDVIDKHGNKLFHEGG